MPPPENQILFRIPPYHYIHVHDQNTNVTRLVIGPLTFARQDHEKVLFFPEKMVAIPPQHYCVVGNPALKDKDGKVVTEKHDQVKLRLADKEIRLTHEPFALYPGEKLVQHATTLTVVAANTALRVRAVRDFTDDDGNNRIAGDEYLFEGPATYMPRVEEEVEETMRATVILPGKALKLVARKGCVDKEGNPRVTGEEWLVSKTGAYMPGAYEKIIGIVDSIVLTDSEALHLEAMQTFKDSLGVVRKTGEQWMVTKEQEEQHMPSVFEKVVAVVDIVTLNKRQYCVILNPVDDKGRPQLGKRRLVKGDKSFFLQPGEDMEGEIMDVLVLSEDESLVLKANEAFVDADTETARQPGDKWLVTGPKEFVAPLEVEIIRRSGMISLSRNEGVYVRDTKTGEVRAEVGKTFMLTEHEELWEKDIPSSTHTMLTRYDQLSDRVKSGDKTRVVTFHVPPSSAVQVFDYSRRRNRTYFGPDIVSLGPDEQFTYITFNVVVLLFLKFLAFLLWPIRR